MAEAGAAGSGEGRVWNPARRRALGIGDAPIDTSVGVGRTVPARGQCGPPEGVNVLRSNPQYGVAPSGARSRRGRRLRRAAGVLTAAILLANPAVSRAWTFSDADWHPVGVVGGLDNAVYAWAVESTGSVYAGGTFTSGVNVAANRVARWNGSAWTNLAEGLNGTVWALAWDGTGNLYAGGEFTFSGELALNHVAKWDGSVWSSLGSGVNGAVYALKLDASGNLYAGGTFTTAGGEAANRVAMWNGSTWTNMGSGMNGAVWALDLQGSSVYAGGEFTTAGDTVAPLVARWDGNAWTNIGSAIVTDAGGNGDIQALTLDQSGNLYVGGSFLMTGSVGWATVARWDGIAWTNFSDSMEGVVLALALDESEKLYAGGALWSPDFWGDPACVAVKTGGHWSNPIGAYGSMEGAGYAIAFDGSGHLYLGGWFEEFVGAFGGPRVAMKHAVMLAEGRWLTMGGDVLNGSVHALMDDASGNLYAGGAFTHAGTRAVNRVAMWNGCTWTNMGAGVQGFAETYVLALARDPWGNLFAGGSFTSAGGVAARNIGKWDGGAWTNVGSGLTGAYSYAWTLVTDPQGNLYAGGSFTHAGGVAANHIAKWDGSAWTNLGSGMNDYVRAITLDASGNVYAVGTFTTAGGVPATNAAVWNGSVWSSLGADIGGLNYTAGVTSLRLGAVALDQEGDIFIGGSFMRAGGVDACSVARWNGQGWTNLGLGVGGWPSLSSQPMIEALAVGPLGNLYAGGTFSKAGGSNASYIARWNGDEWTAMGSGLDWHALALLPSRGFPGRLYVAGMFAEAGSKLAGAVAYAQVEPIFPMTGIVPAEGGELAVAWAGFTTDVQYLETSASLASNDWKIVATNHPPTSPTNVVTLAATNGPAFFRVRNAW